MDFEAGFDSFFTFFELFEAHEKLDFAFPHLVVELVEVDGCGVVLNCTLKTQTSLLHICDEFCLSFELHA